MLGLLDGNSASAYPAFLTTPWSLSPPSLIFPRPFKYVTLPFALRGPVAAWLILPLGNDFHTWTGPFLSIFFLLSCCRSTILQVQVHRCRLQYPVWCEPFPPPPVPTTAFCTSPTSRSPLSFDSPDFFPRQAVGFPLLSLLRCLVCRSRRDLRGNELFEQKVYGIPPRTFTSLR